MAAEPMRRQFTVKDYYRMGKAGILKEDERVELIEGEIIQMPPIGDLHAWCVNRLNRLLVLAVGDAAVVAIQNPLRLGDRSEPVPDIVVMRPRPSLRGPHPTADDGLLVIEVSVTTLAYDQRVKVPLYARLGVPEVWVADLRGEVICVYREPTPDGYRVTLARRQGERIGPSALPDLELAVDDILG